MPQAAQFRHGFAATLPQPICRQLIDQTALLPTSDRAVLDGGALWSMLLTGSGVSAVLSSSCMNDPQSRVTRLKRSPLNYWMLGELNTQPRTSYLAKLRNVNSEIKA